MYNNTIEQYLSELQSSSHTPGGGAVAALNGAQAAALLCMVSSITLAKASHHEAVLQDILDNCKQLVKQFKQEMNDDMKYFNNIMQTYKLPKNTEESKQYRLSEIESKSYASIQHSLDVLKMFSTILDYSQQLKKLCNKNIKSDVHAAEWNAYTGSTITEYNIEANISAIKDKTVVDDINNRVSILVAEIEGKFY